MSELDEPLWGVISERGCEASAMPYDEARALVQRLKGEGIYGMCIVTVEAAMRLSTSQPASDLSGPAKQHEGQ